MSSSSIPAALRRQIIADFANRCAYCHSPELLLDGAYEIDHILPEAAGGMTHRDNLCWTCLLCNAHKGAKQTAVDPLTDQRIALFHPRRQQWNRHFAWSSDGLMILGKTRCGRATIASLQMNSTSLLRMRSYWLRLGASPPYWILEETTE